MTKDSDGYEVRHTKAANFWIDKNKIFHVEYNPLENLGYAESMDELEQCSSMNAKLPVLSVVDISEVKSVSSESRELYSSDRATELYKAVALITRTPLSRVIGNFFLGINRPRMPVRLFSDTSSAVTWLKSQEAT